MGVCDDVSFVFRHFLVEVGGLVGDEEAVGLRELREDRAANERVISVTFHVFL